MDDPGSKDVIRVLERLLVSCSDGVEGYLHAAGEVDDPDIRHFLQRSAADREQIACALTDALVSLGHNPTRHGSAGVGHRRWRALGSVEPTAVHAILNECLRGERETIAAFTGALGRDLSPGVRAIVQAQLGRVLQASAALNRVTQDVAEADALTS